MLFVEDWIKEPKEVRWAHLDLSDPCIERGGNSTVHKGVLAQYLNTNVPFKPKPSIDLCHACNNDKCSNPKHLYWGTRSENTKDAMDNGTWKSIYERCVNKYGIDRWREMNSNNMKGNTSARSLKGKPSNNTKGVNQYSKRFNASVDQSAESNDLKSL